MPLDDAFAPPLLTADLPGIGGKIKTAPEDFEVEEIPAYEPSGQGDFLYLWIEKRDMGAEYFARQIAKRLGIPPGEIGTAGLKDRRAVTRQWVSLPASVEVTFAATRWRRHHGASASVGTATSCGPAICTAIAFAF